MVMQVDYFEHIRKTYRTKATTSDRQSDNGMREFSPSMFGCIAKMSKGMRPLLFT